MAMNKDIGLAIAEVVERLQADERFKPYEKSNNARRQVFYFDQFGVAAKNFTAEKKRQDERGKFTEFALHSRFQFEIERSREDHTRFVEVDFASNLRNRSSSIQLRLNAEQGKSLTLQLDNRMKVSWTETSDRKMKFSQQNGDAGGLRISFHESSGGGVYLVPNAKILLASVGNLDLPVKYSQSSRNSAKITLWMN